MILEVMKDLNKDEIKQGFLASTNACYTVDEISSIISETRLKEGCLVRRSDLFHGFYLEITGSKNKMISQLHLKQHIRYEFLPFGTLLPFLQRRMCRERYT